MTHIWDVPRVVQAVVHLLHECQLNLVLLAEAVHNVRELNEFTAAIDVGVLSRDLQYIVIDVTVVGGWKGRRWEKEGGRGGGGEGGGTGRGRGRGEREKGGGEGGRGGDEGLGRGKWKGREGERGTM